MHGLWERLGRKVEGFFAADQAFAMADNTYDELCVVKAGALAKVPKVLDLIQAASRMIGYEKASKIVHYANNNDMTL